MTTTHIRVSPQTVTAMKKYKEATGSSMGWIVEAAVAGFLEREAQTNLHYKTALEKGR